MDRGGAHSAGFRSGHWFWPTTVSEALISQAVQPVSMERWAHSLIQGPLLGLLGWIGGAVISVRITGGHVLSDTGGTCPFQT